MLKRILAGATMFASVTVMSLSMQASDSEAGVRLYVQPPVAFYGSNYYYPRSYSHRPYYQRRRGYRYGRRHCHRRWRNGHRVRRCHRHRIRY